MSESSKTAVNYVRVDLQATRDGQVVSDLAAGDVQLLEDGVPQRLEEFALVTAPPAPRRIVVFLDTLHGSTEQIRDVREPLAGLIERLLQPGDQVSLVIPSHDAQPLVSTDLTAVAAELRRERPDWGDAGVSAALAAQERRFQSCFPDEGRTRGVAAQLVERRREEITLAALERLVLRLYQKREGRAVILLVSDGWRLQGEAVSASAPPVSGRQGPIGVRRPALAGGERRPARPGGIGSSECDADRARLMRQDNSGWLRRITEDANRALVSFYALHAPVPMPRDAAVARERPEPGDRAIVEARRDSLGQLVTETSGRPLLGGPALETDVVRMIADLSSYYLLGYRSTNMRLDGRFRNVTVRSTRAGVQVRVRRGYRGLTAEQLLATAEWEAAPPDAATAMPAAAPPLRIRAATWTAPASGATSVWAVGEIDYQTRKTLTWSAGATAEIVLLAGDGRQVAAGAVNLASGEPSFAARVPDSGSLEPGDYALGVRVRAAADPASVLTASARVNVASNGPSLGEAILWRRGPATGQKLVVTADLRFQRNERIRLEWPTATGEQQGMARLLDRADNPLRVPVEMSERTDGSGEFQWVVAEAVLAPLAAGEYAVEVTYGGATRVTRFRVVP